MVITINLYSIIQLGVKTKDFAIMLWLKHDIIDSTMYPTKWVET